MTNLYLKSLGPPVLEIMAEMPSFIFYRIDYISIFKKRKL